MIANYFIGSSLTAIPSIVGAAVWSASNDIFTLVGIYDFHWFVSVTSFVFSIIGYALHTFSFIFEVIQQRNLIHLHVAAILLIGGLYTLFWFISAVNLSIILRQCMDIKKSYQHFLNDDLHLITDTYKYNYSCNGEIVSMTFSYVNFIVWSIILFKSAKVWYDRYVFDNATSIQMQNIEEQIPIQQEQSQVEPQIQQVEQTIQVEISEPVVEQAAEIQEQSEEQSDVLQEQSVIQEQSDVLQEQSDVLQEQSDVLQEQSDVLQEQSEEQSEGRKSKGRKYTGRPYKK